MEEENLGTDLKLINDLLTYVPWRQALVTRHHKYLEVYTQHPNIVTFCRELGLHENEALNILWRVQQQLIQVALFKGLTVPYHLHRKEGNYDYRLVELYELLRSTPVNFTQGLSIKQRSLITELRAGMTLYQLREKFAMPMSELERLLYAPEDGIVSLLKLGYHGLIARVVDITSVKRPVNERLTEVLETARIAQDLGFDIESALSDRQREVLTVLNEGYGPEEAAKRLGIRQKSLYDVLWARNRSSIVKILTQQLQA